LLPDATSSRDPWRTPIRSQPPPHAEAVLEENQESLPPSSAQPRNAATLARETPEASR
jgi:hypothetical protein